MVFLGLCRVKSLYVGMSIVGLSFGYGPQGLGPEDTQFRVWGLGLKV